jgi:hypothetical protein
MDLKGRFCCCYGTCVKKPYSITLWNVRYVENKYWLKVCHVISARLSDRSTRSWSFSDDCSNSKLGWIKMTHRVRSLLKIGLSQLGRTFADQPVIWKSAPLPGISVIRSRTVGSAGNLTLVTVKYGTVRIRIHLFTLVRIRIYGDNQCRSRILTRLHFHNKLNFFYPTSYVGNTTYLCSTVQKPFWKVGIQFYLLIFVNFLVPGSGSAFPRIQKSQNQCGSDPHPQHWNLNLLGCFFVSFCYSC